MGRNLSNLFISQSYQFITQISGSELQDGLGNTITGSLLITASKADTATTAVSASYSNVATSASYALVSTSSSFAINATNAVSASTATSASFAITASFALNAGSTVSTSSLLTTASAAGNVITFTKGDGSTFPVTVATGSGGTGSLDTGSLLITASVVDATITYTKGDGSTFTNTVNNVANAVSATQANEVSVVTDGTNASRYVTFANTLSGYDSNRADAGLTYNPFSNILTATTFAGNATSATSASLADKVDVTLDGTNNTRFVTFVDATSGASDVKADAGITYNPSTNRLITTTFEGALDGNANTAISASYAVSASQAQNAVTASFALNVTPIDTGSFVTTASISNATTTFTKGDGSTFSITANNVVNADSASVATSASYALSASQAQNAVSASFATTASFVASVVSASYALSASQAANATSASFATTAVSSSFATSSSQAQNAVTASFALSASNTPNALVTASASGATITFSKGDGTTFPISVTAAAFPYTGSAEITGSLIVTGSLLMSQGVGNVLLPMANTGNNISFAGNGAILGGVNGSGNYNLRQGDVVLGGYGANTFTMDGGGNHMFTSRGSMTGFGVFNYLLGGDSNRITPFVGGGYGQGIIGGNNNEIKQIQQTAFILGSSNSTITGTNAGGDNPQAVILGGDSHNIFNGKTSVILGGISNTISQSVGTPSGSYAAILASSASRIDDYTGTAIIGGANVTASASNTVYVPNLKASGSGDFRGKLTISQSQNDFTAGAFDLYSERNGQSLITMYEYGGQAVIKAPRGNGLFFIEGGGGGNDYVSLNNSIIVYPPGGTYNRENGVDISANTRITGSLVISGSLSQDNGNSILAIQGPFRSGDLNKNAILTTGGNEGVILAGVTAFSGSGGQLITFNSSSACAIIGSRLNQFGGLRITNATSSVIIASNQLSEIKTNGSGNPQQCAIIAGDGVIADGVGAGLIAASDNSSISGNSNTRGQLAILGNNSSTLSGLTSVILGGRNHTMNTTFVQDNALLGGDTNTLTNSNLCFIAGGKENRILNCSSGHSAIIAGKNNLISGNITGSVVIGGVGITGSLSDTVYVPNLIASGSLRGLVTSSVTTSNTASLNFSRSNFFTLNTDNVLNTYIEPTNVLPGQTVTLELTYPASASVITFPSFVKQPSGSAYVSSGANTTDILTFTVLSNTGSVYLTSVKNFI